MISIGALIAHATLALLGTLLMMIMLLSTTTPVLHTTSFHVVFLSVAKI